MNCQCRKQMEQAMVERTQAQQPGATDVEATLEDGYGIVLGNNRLLGRPIIPGRITYTAPKANGKGTKKVKKRFTAVAAFCPFCGVRLEDSDDA